MQMKYAGVCLVLFNILSCKEYFHPILHFIKIKKVLGPVVQSIDRLTSSLRGQLAKCFMTLLPNTMTFFVEIYLENIGIF